MERKIVVLVGDGMADLPLETLGGLTPLAVAHTPNLDRLAGCGTMGTVRTVPKGMEPGSDVANMSLLGYDPLRYHTGRSPLEAASMGIALGPEDVAFRCNLVSLDISRPGHARMLDYSAGHISTEEANEIIESLQSCVAGTPLSLYPGVSYRHLLVWADGRSVLQTTPPHDIPGKEIAAYMKCYADHPLLQSFIDEALAVLADHPVNRSRLSSGKSPANSVWLWGQGKAPAMPTLKERANLTGAMISAVDLLKGLGVYAGLDPVRVEGATGYLDTNYEGKVSAALKALDSGNFVFLHIEAPDEASHEGSLEKKIKAIEAFDQKVVGPVMQGLGRHPGSRVLITADHLTPIEVRTHVGDPVPFLIVDDPARARDMPGNSGEFSEASAGRSGLKLESGTELFSLLIR